MYCISISHKTAPLEIRELFSFHKEEAEQFLKGIIKQEHIHECVLVSTCNRSEVYFRGDLHVLSAMEKYFAEFKKIELDKVLEYYRIYQDEKAMLHLYRVTSGMDSMLLGEDEILGQIKFSYQQAHEAGTTGFILNRIFLGAITCAKKIKTDTKLSKIPISIGTLTANEVLRYSEDIKKVLIIGITGSMGTIVRKNLSGKSDVKIIGTTRNHNIQGAMKVEDPQVTMIPYRERYHYMNDADIIISATTSPHYTITSENLRDYIHTDKKRLFIDLAVPHDIDKEIKKINYTEVMDIDHFEDLSNQNNLAKLHELDYANLIIAEQVDEVRKDLNFQKFRKDIPKYQKLLQDNTFEAMIYRMKKNTSNTEFEAVLKAFKTLLS